MNTWQRILSSVVLLAVAGGSVFGFLATFEPGDFVVWRVAYAGLGLLCLGGLLVTWAGGKGAVSRLPEGSRAGGN